jgi:hypothetical protein
MGMTGAKIMFIDSLGETYGELPVAILIVSLTVVPRSF